MTYSLLKLLFFLFPVCSHLVFFFFCLYVGHRPHLSLCLNSMILTKKPPTCHVNRTQIKKYKLLKLIVNAPEIACKTYAMVCICVSLTVYVCLSACVWQACAPLWSQECGTSMFSTGICASVSDDLEPRETIAPTAQSNHTLAHTHWGKGMCSTGFL